MFGIPDFFYNKILNIAKHKLFKNGLVYTGSSLIVKAIPFLLLPLLTRFLSPKDYGLTATFGVILSITSVVIELGMYTGLVRNFFKLKIEDFKYYVGTVLLIETVNFLFIFIVFLMCRDLLSKWINFPRSWLLPIVVTAFLQNLYTLCILIWRIEQKPIPYGIFQVVQTVLNVSLSVIFIVILHMNWQGQVAGVLITSCICGPIGIYMVYKKRLIKISKQLPYSKNALKLGIPVVPHYLGFWMVNSFDRLFINSLVGLVATGIYSVGSQIGQIVFFLASAFNEAWSPFLYDKMKLNDHKIKVKIVKFTYLYFVSILIFSLLLSLAAPFFLKVFVGKNFQDASKYILLIALAHSFRGMYFMVVNYIFQMEKNYILPFITFTSGALNIVLNIVFIKRNGAIGAAQSMLVTNVFTFLLTWVLSSRVCKMPWLFWNPVNYKKPILTSE